MSDLPTRVEKLPPFDLTTVPNNTNLNVYRNELNPVKPENTGKHFLPELTIIEQLFPAEKKMIEQLRQAQPDLTNEIKGKFDSISFGTKQPPLSKKELEIISQLPYAEQRMISGSLDRMAIVKSGEMTTHEETVTDMRQAVDLAYAAHEWGDKRDPLEIYQSLMQLRFSQKPSENLAVQTVREVVGGPGESLPFHALSTVILTAKVDKQGWNHNIIARDNKDPEHHVAMYIGNKLWRPLCDATQDLQENIEHQNGSDQLSPLRKFFEHQGLRTDNNFEPQSVRLGRFGCMLREALDNRTITLSDSVSLFDWATRERQAPGEAKPPWTNGENNGLDPSNYKIEDWIREFNKGRPNNEQIKLPDEDQKTWFGNMLKRNGLTYEQLFKE